MKTSIRFKLRQFMLRKVLEAVRWLLVNRKATWVSDLGAATLVRAEGRFMSGRFERAPDGSIVGLTMFWHIPGRSLTDLKRVPISTIKRDPHLGIVFYAD